MAVDRRRARGFSMLESLVSLAIAASVISAYYQAISTSLELERRTRARTEAAILTHDLIDQVGFEIPLIDGSQSGTGLRGTSWRLTISKNPGLVSPAGLPQPSTDRLLQVEVNIEGPDLPSGYRLVTLRASGDTLR